MISILPCLLKFSYGKQSWHCSIIPLWLRKTQKEWKEIKKKKEKKKEENKVTWFSNYIIVFWLGNMRGWTD